MFVRKVRNQDVYNLHNHDGSIISTHPTRRQAKKVLLGGGLLDNIRAIQTGTRLKGMPPKSRKTLQDYGDHKIIHAEIFRYVIPSYLTYALNLYSAGKTFNSVPYDKLFHLGIIFTLDNGRKILVEKNEIVNIVPFSKSMPSDAEYRLVSLNGQQLTLNEIIDNTINRMGLSKFETYHAFSLNCQNMILNLLRSNKIGNKADEEFVIQDLSKIINNIDKFPKIRKVINSLTDLARAFNIAVYGAGRIV